MLSKEEFKAKVIALSEKAGDNEDIMNGLKELQDSYNESIDAAPAGAAYNDADVMDTDGKRWAEKYAELRTEYRNRFFGGGEPPKQPEPIDAPGVPGNSKDDPANVTFDDLFEERK